MEHLSASEIQSHLGLSDRCRDWLERIAAAGDVDDVVLPDDASANSLLLSLGVEAPDRDACLAGRPDRGQHPALWWLLRYAHHEIVANLGRNLAGGWYTGWPSLPKSLGPVGRMVLVWALLAAAPRTRRFHQERGIPPEVSEATVSAVGTDLSFWRAVTGLPGITATWTLPLVFNGASYRLGRHMFDRDGSRLNVHVPAGGPLDPAVSQASFDWARTFFPRHFPEDAIATFVCHSWLLDEQWAEYLPETSNIMQFQRRFSVGADGHRERGDNDILLYVFGRESDGPTPSRELLNSLPQDTTLQRAYVRHLERGGHWWTRDGWFSV